MTVPEIAPLFVCAAIVLCPCSRENAREKEDCGQEGFIVILSVNRKAS